jgi:hypothetical protein
MKKLISLFWFIWATSLLLGLVEAINYPGYLFNKFGFNMEMTFIFIAFLSVIVLLFKYIKKDFYLQKTDRIITIFSAFIMLMYLALKIVNRLTYDGFVFNKLHVLPDGLLWPALISLLSIAVVLIPQIKFNKLFNIRSVILIFTFLLILFNLRQIYKSEWQTFHYIIANPKATYGDKMRRELCPIFYDYTLFINKYTSEYSSLLMPPQTFPWPFVGNGGMLRYFVYPRKITNGEEYEAPSIEVLKNIDYVLLNWGETEQTQGVYTHEWPKFDVKAEKIIFMNEDGSYAGEVKGDYYYNNYKGRRVWGLIVVKH